MGRLQKWNLQLTRNTLSLVWTEKEVRDLFRGHDLEIGHDSIPITNRCCNSGHRHQSTTAATTPFSTKLEEPLLTSSPALEEPLDTDSSSASSLSSSDDDNDEKNASLPLDKSRLLFFRSIFFLQGLSDSTWGRFGVLYYDQVKHLSEEQIGLLQGLMRLIGFVTLPFWGYVADAIIQSRKKVFLGCSLMFMMALLSLPFAANFSSILVCVIVMALFKSSGVLDAHALDFLGEKHRSRYGTIRIMTAISCGVGNVLMGWIAGSYGFTWNFILYGMTMSIVLCLTAFGLPARSRKEQEQYDRLNNSAVTDEPSTAAATQRPRFLTLMRSLMKFPIALWLIEVAVMGAGMSLVDSFLFVYLKEDLQGSTQLCGYSVGFTVLFELPVFRYSEYLLEKAGHDVLLVVAMLAYIVRSFGYIFLTVATVNWVLALELLHGITFACMWIASVDYSARVAPDEWSTTVQSILSMVMKCVGGGIGPILGGIVMEKYGAHVMFQGMGSIIGVVTLVHLVAWLICGHGHDAFLRRLEAR